MNDQPNQPPNSNQPPVPEDSTTAWESAMSRDFEDRVRDLHETPLTFDSVKGKAMSIRRNRRIAVAGGVLAAAAVIVPVAVIASDAGPAGAKPDFAPAPDDAASPDDGRSTDVPIDGIDTAGIDYINDGVWVRADGTEVELPEGGYFEAVVWDDLLVASRVVGEGAYAATDVIDADGNVVDEVTTTGGLAVSDDHTILAYVTDAGDLVTRWDGGESVLATDVTDSGGGESPGAHAVSVVGTAPCEPESGSCLVRVNTDFECVGYGSSDVPLPDDALTCIDEQDGNLTYVNERTEDNTVCGGLYDGAELEFLWQTCDYEPGPISPDGAYVLAPPSQYDGLGYRTLAILDATTGEVTGQYGAEGDASFIWSDAGWSDDGNAVFTVYDGANWHLLAMAPDGEIAEIVDPVKGEDVDNPFVVIQD